jgi:hypothetical protein
MMASGFTMVPTVKRHTNKGSKIRKFAEGGVVRNDDDDPAGIPTLRGGLPKAARSAWDRIPSVKEFARTGKIFPSSEDVDRAERRERAKETNRKRK